MGGCRSRRVGLGKHSGQSVNFTSASRAILYVFPLMLISMTPRSTALMLPRAYSLAAWAGRGAAVTASANTVALHNQRLVRMSWLLPERKRSCLESISPGGVADGTCGSGLQSPFGPGGINMADDD